MTHTPQFGAVSIIMAICCWLPSGGSHADAQNAASQPAVAAAEQSSKYSFQRRTFDVRRERGRLYLGKYWYEKPLTDQPVYAKLIETFDGVRFKTDREMKDWARKLRSTRTYTYDVVAETVDGKTKFLGPLVLLPKDKYKLVEPHWRHWRTMEDQMQRERILIQQEYELEQARAEAESQRQQQLVDITAASARSLAVISGVTSLWEVELIPPGSQRGLFGFGQVVAGQSAIGVGYYPQGVFLTSGPMSLSGGSWFPTSPYPYQNPDSMWVQSYGRDSRAASAAALAKYPGHRVGIVRKLSGF